MVAMRVRPTAVTFNALLNACGTSGEWGAAQVRVCVYVCVKRECLPLRNPLRDVKRRIHHRV